MPYKDKYEDWPEERKEKYRERARKFIAKQREENPDKILEQKKRSFLKRRTEGKLGPLQQARLDAVKILGNKCERCDFDDPRALQIDHITDNGNRERKKIGNYQIYKKIKNGELEGYQVLCANCNWIKRSEQNEHSWRAKAEAFVKFVEEFDEMNNEG